MAGEGQQGREVWSAGEGYEGYVGRWSRLVAREFVGWLAVSPGARWLDVGCGTGALVETVLQNASPAAVTGIDRSEGYVAHARALLRGRDVDLRVGDAQSLPFNDRVFDAAVSGLVLNFVADKDSMVSEMVRVVRPGGAVAAYVWDYAGEMQLMRRFWDAAVSLDPAADELDEGRRFPVCRPDALADLFRSRGLAEIETRAIDVPTRFRDFDDYWAPFLSGEGPAPGYTMSLAEKHRAALREKLRSTLQTRADGSIEMTARAWAVKGKRPERGGN